jgi:adenylate cyclase class 2
MLEREIKLRFTSAQEARDAVLAIGATLLRGRRFQDDALLDNEGEELRRRRCALRLRREDARNYLTFKGPVQPGPMKLREELETVVSDAGVLQRILEHLDLRVWFRYQKYREEFALDGVVVAIDETPIGVFVELEGTEAGITAAAAALGRTTADYILDSYYGLFMRRSRALGFRGAHDLRRARPHHVRQTLPPRLRRAGCRGGHGPHGRAGHAHSAALHLKAKPALPVAGVPLAGRILRWLAAAVTDAV